MSALDIFSPTLWLVTAGVFGAIFGSFANVVIWRLPRGMSIVVPGSHCPTCGTFIAPYDNIPVLSWLVLRACCRTCAVPISPRYPLVEFSLGLLSVACFRDTILYAGNFGAVPVINYFVGFAFCWALVVITFIDLDTQLIPLILTAGMTVVGLASHFLLPGGTPKGAAIGVALGFGVVWVLALGYRLIRGVEGMGFGDAHLMAMVGSVLGWQGAIFCLVAGSIQGVLMQLAMFIGDKKWRRGPITSWRRPVPFGPFLSLGALEYVVFGSHLQPLYRALLMG